jgi:beta-lactamase regulating signal transducer with metallopeptidase domain/protein involved in polysaccharide export with SLBB domain
VNAFSHLLPQPESERLGWVLLHFLWQGLVIAVLLRLAQQALRRVSSQVRYALACTAMLMLAAAPVLTFFSFSSNRLVRAAPTLAQPTVSHPFPNISPAAQQLSSSPSTPPESIAFRLRPALPVIVSFWLIGILSLFLWHGAGWFYVHKLRHRHTRLLDFNRQTRLSRLASQLGLRQSVLLLESGLIQVPAVIGFLRPVILVPASALLGLSPQQLDALLLHELAHIRRHDYLANLTQVIIETLLFYHPATWWVSQQVRHERENCCDDIASEACGDRLLYVQSLASMEALRGMGRFALAANGPTLLHRIRRLLATPGKPRSFAWPLAAIFALIAAILLPLLFMPPRVSQDAAVRAIQQRNQLQHEEAIQEHKAQKENAQNEIRAAREELAAARNQVFAAEDALSALENRQRAGTPQTPEFLRLKGQSEAALIGARKSEAQALSRYNAASASNGPARFPATRPIISPILPEDLEVIRENYVLARFDLVTISIANPPNPENVRTARISPDGLLSIPSLKEPLQASGLTEIELQKAITEKLKSTDTQSAARVSVTVIEASQRTFTITGAVATPGQYALLRADFRIPDAIKLAGGLSANARRIYIARHADALSSNTRKPNQQHLRLLEIPASEFLSGNSSHNIVIRQSDSIIVAQDE